MAVVKRPRDRKATILAASAELFADRGYAAVGIDQIAAKVGVTGPAIYRHYGGKGALFNAVMEKAVSDLAEVIEANSDETFEVVMRAVVQHTLDSPMAIAAWLQEHQRLGLPAPSVAKAERRSLEAWARTVAKVRPDLDKLRMTVRQLALASAIAEGALHQEGVERPRLDELLATSGLAYITFESPSARLGGSSVEPQWPEATRREAILHSAISLFRVRGVRSVGIDEIGVAAGISGPAVYHYFSSKADIVMGAFDLIGERVEAGIEEAVRLSRTPADALERLARSYIQVAFDGLDLMVATSREREAVRRSARNRLQRRNRFVRDSWVSVVRQVRLDAPDSEIRLLVRTVFPLMQQAVEASEGHREFLEELVGPTVAYLTL